MQEEDEILRALREEWDRAADRFDEEPDHGLHPENVRQAWTRLLETWLPPAPARVLDVGCGTGSLSLALAQAGRAVVGIDLSPAMITRARAKARAAGVAIDFLVMNAAQPDFPAGSFDALVCRHLLWVFPRPAEVLNRWAARLKPGGRLFLVEGFWSTGAGLRTDDLLASLPPSTRVVTVQDLSQDPDYWGKPVNDERYLVVADVER